MPPAAGLLESALQRWNGGSLLSFHISTFPFFLNCVNMVAKVSIRYLLLAVSKNSPQAHANANCHECSRMNNIKPQFANRRSREKWNPKERAEEAEQHNENPGL
jgi:hypothetical protein